MATKAPPTSQSHLQRWVRENLFSTWYNSILTIVCLVAIVPGLISFVSWVFSAAQWEAVTANLRLFFVGQFPQELYWRLWVSLAILAGLTVISASFVRRRLPPTISTWLPGAWGLAFVVILWLIKGGLGLEPTATNAWMGLLLTLLVATISIVLSFPLGVMLALGRQSELPVVRALSILYIELIRGLPLIGILFLAQFMLPLFLPPFWRDLDRVLRAIAGLVLFSAAYLAENVRGGLQAVPRGQAEAGSALGLSTPLVVLLIVLPQALRAVIPAIVGQFIGLFKDTSLLALFGLLELTGIGRTILAQPQFLGRYAEVYLFIGLIYWVFCYGMSVASRKLERKLNVDQR